MAAYRERSLPLFPEAPPRAPQFRRMQCKCGCCWFYVERKPGRPMEYATLSCAYRAKKKREARSRYLDEIDIAHTIGGHDA